MVAVHISGGEENRSRCLRHGHVSGMGGRTDAVGKLQEATEEAVSDCEGSWNSNFTLQVPRKELEQAGQQNEWHYVAEGEHRFGGEHLEKGQAGIRVRGHESWG